VRSGSALRAESWSFSRWPATRAHRPGAVHVSRCGPCVPKYLAVSGNLRSPSLRLNPSGRGRTALRSSIAGQAHRACARFRLFVDRVLRFLYAPPGVRFLRFSAVPTVAGTGGGFSTTCLASCPALLSFGSRCVSMCAYPFQGMGPCRFGDHGAPVRDRSDSFRPPVVGSWCVASLRVCGFACVDSSVASCQGTPPGYHSPPCPISCTPPCSTGGRCPLGLGDLLRCPRD
jgi:hypothetical protein